MSDQTELARVFFDSCSAEYYLDEALMRIFGATGEGETDVDTWPCTHIVYDPYDASFELWGIADDWLPTPDQLEQAFALGFSRCWFVCRDGHTQRYAEIGKPLSASYVSQIDRASESKYLERKKLANMTALKLGLQQVITEMQAEGRRALPEYEGDAAQRYAARLTALLETP